MKKTLTLLLICAAIGSMAQENMFKKGDKVLNIGLGLGSTLYTGSYFKTTVPPISASFELGTHEGIFEKGSIGLGGYLGFSKYKYEYSGWGFNYSDFILGVRGSFHYPLIEKLDTYSGLLIGYEVLSAKEFGTSFGYDGASTGGVIWSWYAGGRYYFTDQFAAMLELGYGITYLNLGVVIKL